VYTLNEERIKLGNQLSTNPELELSGLRSGRRKQAIGVVLYIGNKSVFDPDVAHEITLRTNRDGDFVVRTEGADVIHTLRLHSEVGITFVVLAEEADLGFARDVDILGTHRHKLN